MVRFVSAHHANPEPLVNPLVFIRPHSLAPPQGERKKNAFVYNTTLPHNVGLLTKV